MAMAPPMCAARKTFERKTSLLVRSGGSCQPRIVQKCTEEGSRWTFADSAAGGYCPVNLWTHSGHGLPLFSVHVVACVVDGALGSPALFEAREGEPVSWHWVEGVLNRKPSRMRTKAGQNLCFTIAPLALTFLSEANYSEQSVNFLSLELSKKRFVSLAA